MKFAKYLITWFLVVGSLAGVGLGLYFMYEDGHSLTYVLLLGFYTLNLSASIIVFVQKRQFASKLSWMMLFLLLPFISIAVFALFGQRYKGRGAVKEYRQRDSFKHERRKMLAGKNIEENMLNAQSNISGRGIYSVDAKVFSNGDEGYDSLFADLEKAKKFIHLQYYIIKPGEIFDRLKSILLKKANEGVEVRFIVDDFGRWAVPWHEIKALKKEGIKIVRFGKVYFPFIGSANGYRLHRKTAIIDGEIVHTGGVNIADEYSNMNKKFGLWLDYQVRLEGEAVRSYSLLYLDDWKFVTGETLDQSKYLNEKKVGKSKFVMIEDSPEVEEPIMQDSIINMILNAKKEITLTSPYFIPTSELFNAIRTAALSGVKVKIIIPGKPDKRTVLWATRHYSRMLAKYGVEIHEANNVLIHAKIGMFDGKYAYLGTANLDIRSLYSQWETIQLLTGPVVKDINKVLNNYLSYTTRVSEDKLKISNFREKISRIYVNLFSPIM